MTKTGVRRWILVALCAAIASNGCASARLNRASFQVPSDPARGQTIDRAVLAEYVQKLPLGVTVRVDRTTGRTLRGTLIKASNDSIIVQPKTRIPEPAVQIPLGEVLRLTPEPSNGANIGKAIGVGVATGAGAALAVFLIIVAIFAD